MLQNKYQIFQDLNVEIQIIKLFKIFRWLTLWIKKDSLRRRAKGKSQVKMFMYSVHKNKLVCLYKTIQRLKTKSEPGGIVVKLMLMG